MNLKIAEYPERYFAGMAFEGGVHIDSADVTRISSTWQTFFHKILPLVKDTTEEPHFIGLEIYPNDFLKNRVFEYYAMVETKQLDSIPGVVTKTIPAGKYISFELSFDHLQEGIHQSYQYLNDNQIKYDMSFDFEDYINDQNYTLKDQRLYFSIRIE